ncbi:MAG: replication-associated recombination protein A [Firmicutes bacterium]|nr:replication-associated recombination protein A [Bacillota bacterium]
MDLFDFAPDNTAQKNAPLAMRMRPLKLDEFIGQKHILAKDSLLLRAIRADKLGSCIFYGPPGTGKTTLAAVIAAATKGNFEKLNAVSSGVSDAKAVIDRARDAQKLYGKRTYLVLDECHRWNKAQSDCVLSAIEDGSIIFIGTTTENPFVSMTRAIVSRCRIFEFKSLTEEEILEGLNRAIFDKERGFGMYNLTVSDDAMRHFAWAANGDLRNALNALELAVISTPPDGEGHIAVDLEAAQQSAQRKSLSVDESMYYDMLSAFCKSLRGSDPNAALYWAFRLTEGGCDPLLIFRRLLAHACEDVGMADSNALNVVMSAYLAFERMGYSEGALPMTHAIVYVCTAPKSNSIVNAKGAAIAAARNSGDANVPFYLRDRSYPSVLDDGSPYLYPHDYGGYCKQQYLPDSLKDAKFYVPGENGNEKRVGEFLKDINRIQDKR